MASVKIPHPGMGFKEFVALVASLMAANALGVDSMLPALQQIGGNFGIHDANENQWILSSYMLGFGTAQLFYGTLLDRYGRKPILLWGLGCYVLLSVAIVFSGSFGLLLAARALQGVAAAAARVAATSIVRDCYAGRMMARVMSFAFIVFMGVPALAPSLGQLIMVVAPWRGIFLGLAAFGAFVFAWVAMRLPETLQAEDRTPIAFLNVMRTFRVILGNRFWLGYSLAMMMVFGSMMAFIISSPQVFLVEFKEPKIFPAIFALIAGCIAASSFLNARLVGQWGMRMLSHSALLGFILFAGIHASVAFLGFETVWSFTLLQCLMMFCFGLLVGNFGAVAMEPMGHMAGTAASLQGFIATVGGALVGFAIGQSFNGNDIPLTVGVLMIGVSTLVILLVTEGGKLFTRSTDLAVAEAVK